MTNDRHQELLAKISQLPDDDAWTVDFKTRLTELVRRSHEVDREVQEEVIAGLEVLAEEVAKRGAAIAADRDEMFTKVFQLESEIVSEWQYLRPIDESLYVEMAKWRVGAMLTINSAAIVAIISSDHIRPIFKQVTTVALLGGALCALVAGWAISKAASQGLTLRTRPQPPATYDAADHRLKHLRGTLLSYEATNQAAGRLLFCSMAFFAIGVLGAVFGQ